MTACTNQNVANISALPNFFQVKKRPVDTSASKFASTVHSLVVLSVCRNQLIENLGCLLSSAKAVSASSF